MIQRRSRVEAVFESEVERSRERLLEQAARFGAAFRSAANPLRLLKRDAVGLTFAALAAGLMIGLLTPGRRSPAKKKATRESPASSGPLAAVAAGILPALVPALVSLIEERRHQAPRKQTD